MEKQDMQGVVNLIFDKLAKLFSRIFPGMLVLELFFKRGFFSNSPNDIFSFILYILWAAILSVPYNFVSPITISIFMDELVKEADKKHNFKLTLNPNKEKLESMEDAIVLGHLFIKCLLTYIIFKIYQISTCKINFIPEKLELIILLLSTLLISTFLSYPLAYLYTRFLKNVIIKYAKKRFSK